MTGFLSKTEKVLIGMAAAFLCLLWASVPLRRPAASGVTVETARQAAASAVVPVDGARIDLNTAPAEELAELPGIGEVLAERIVAYRTEHGPFAAAEDVQAVDGIGPGRFAGMEDLVTAGTAGTEGLHSGNDSNE